MDLFETLKKLKGIEPDRGFSLNSRNLILNTAPKIKIGVWNIILKNIELGAALALAGLLIFLTIGGFSAWRFLAPLQLTNLDPSSIRAEAEAIDIQIKLADLNYAEPTSTATSESTKMSAAAGQGNKNSSRSAGAPASQNSNSSSAISIDEALEKLSE
jgi:hypothetical protein